MQKRKRSGFIFASFSRSLPGQTRPGARQQLNQNTAFIDCSHVYGSDPCKLDDLRLFEGGRLEILDHPESSLFKELLPANNRNPECRSPLGMCFHAGIEYKKSWLSHILRSDKTATRVVRNLFEQMKRWLNINCLWKWLIIRNFCIWHLDKRRKNNL